MGRLTNEEVDDLVQHEYEEALANGERWAEETFAYRRAFLSADMGESDP